MVHFLGQDPQLQLAALEPGAPGPAMRDVAVEMRPVVRTWNLHGGLLEALSDRVGIDVGCALAVLCVESGGAAFGPDGRMVIRFENHVFRREWGGRAFDRYFTHDGARPWEGHRFRSHPDEPWAPFHGRQDMEWTVFDLARRRDETAAMRSISMGAPQIMGFNHARIGYGTVQEMFARFSADVRFQVFGLFDFMTAGAVDSPMLDALRARDFGRFASGYNGPGQASVYGALIARHVELFEQLRGSVLPRAAAASSRATRVPSAATADRSTTAEEAAVEPTMLPGRSYVVRAGDTLSAIAGRYGVALGALAELNAIADFDRIRNGQVLLIPEVPAPPPPPMPAAHVLPNDLDEPEPGALAPTYTVQPGDTLGAIARRLRIAMAVLVELNAIPDANRIRTGQVLRLPD